MFNVLKKFFSLFKNEPKPLVEDEYKYMNDEEFELAKYKLLVQTLEDVGFI